MRCAAWGEAVSYTHLDVYKRQAQEEAEEARSAAKTLNMRLEKILPAGLSGREHQLVIYKKLGQTPKGYPRKFAKIKARPL